MLKLAQAIAALGCIIGYALNPDDTALGIFAVINYIGFTSNATNS